MPAKKDERPKYSTSEEVEDIYSLGEPLSGTRERETPHGPHRPHRPRIASP